MKKKEKKRKRKENLVSVTDMRLLLMQRGNTGAAEDALGRVNGEREKERRREEERERRRRREQKMLRGG